VVQDLASGDIQIQPSSRECLQLQKNDTLGRLKRLGNPVKARYNNDPSISVGRLFLTKLSSQDKHALYFFEKIYFADMKNVRQKRRSSRRNSEVLRGEQMHGNSGRYTFCFHCISTYCIHIIYSKSTLTQCIDYTECILFLPQSMDELPRKQPPQ
jgi:hypothetical protein